MIVNLRSLLPLIILSSLHTTSYEETLQKIQKHFQLSFIFSHRTHSVVQTMARSHTKIIVSCLFWWSLVITSTTPLFRYILSNQWFAVSATGLFPAYKGVAEEPAKDRAFGLHALFALTWMIMAYIQICFLDHTKRSSVHKVFGYLTVRNLHRGSYVLSDF